MTDQTSTDRVTLSLPLPWQESIWHRFNHHFQQGRMPHAVMLSGTAGIGMESLAQALSQRVLCSSETSQYACGTCKPCQLMIAGSHADLTILEPKQEGKQILIDQVRSLTSLLGKTSQQGGWKVAIISPAEAMNTASSNALLKSLEEPQGKTLLILISYRPSLVPATIRSRCQIEHLPVPESALAVHWLAEVTGDKQQAEAMLQIATGRPLLALQYMQADNLAARQNFDDIVEKVRGGHLSPLEAAQQCQTLNSGDLLDWFMSYLHRLVTGELQNHSNPALFIFSDKLMSARSWLLSDSNINTQLLWEGLFTDWLQVFHASDRG